MNVYNNIEGYPAPVSVTGTAHTEFNGQPVAVHPNIYSIDASSAQAPPPVYAAATAADWHTVEIATPQPITARNEQNSANNKTSSAVKFVIQLIALLVILALGIYCAALITQIRNTVSAPVQTRLVLQPNTAIANPYIRLMDGGSSYAGRVEVHYKSEWGTVCDDNWDIKDARVVCRMLGFSGAESALQSAHYGAGSGRIWLDDVQCGGSELSLWDCRKNAWGNENCGHGEDASVVCSL